MEHFLKKLLGKSKEVKSKVPASNLSGIAVRDEQNTPDRLGKIQKVEPKNYPTGEYRAQDSQGLPQIAVEERRYNSEQKQNISMNQKILEIVTNILTPYLRKYRIEKKRNIDLTRFENSPTEAVGSLGKRLNDFLNEPEVNEMLNFLQKTGWHSREDLEDCLKNEKSFPEMLSGTSKDRLAVKAPELETIAFLNKEVEKVSKEKSRLNKFDPEKTQKAKDHVTMRASLIKFIGEKENEKNPTLEKLFDAMAHAGDNFIHDTDFGKSHLEPLFSLEEKQEHLEYLIMQFTPERRTSDNKLKEHEKYDRFSTPTAYQILREVLDTYTDFEVLTELVTKDAIGEKVSKCTLVDHDIVLVEWGNNEDRRYAKIRFESEAKFILSQIPFEAFTNEEKKQVIETYLYGIAPQTDGTAKFIKNKYEELISRQKR